MSEKPLLVPKPTPPFLAMKEAVEQAEDNYRKGLAVAIGKIDAILAGAGLKKSDPLTDRDPLGDDDNERGGDPVDSLDPDMDANAAQQQKEAKEDEDEEDDEEDEDEEEPEAKDPLGSD